MQPQQPLKLQARKVIEVPSRLVFAVPRQLFVANELPEDLEVVPEESSDGVRPRLLLRIRKKK